MSAPARGTGATQLVANFGDCHGAARGWANAVRPFPPCRSGVSPSRSSTSITCTRRNRAKVFRASSRRKERLRADLPPALCKEPGCHVTKKYVRGQRLRPGDVAVRLIKEARLHLPTRGVISVSNHLEAEPVDTARPQRANRLFRKLCVLLWEGRWVEARKIPPPV